MRHPCGILVVLALLGGVVPVQGAWPEPERPPVVIVPGAPATELIDSRDGHKVWPNLLRMLFWDGNDVLALDPDDAEATPIVPGRLVRSVNLMGKTIRFRSYDGLEAKLRSLGYVEGDLAAPRADAYYFFLYDWRLSVESNAKKLHAALRRLRLDSPPGTPRAIVIGHSIGGLLARYALMYGDAPLGRDGPLPPITWEGANFIDAIFLVATPNAGTFLALDAVHRGSFWWRHWGAFSPDVLATFPAMFDLMPARAEPLVDATGAALPQRLDTVEGWEALGWGPLRSGSRRFADREAARAYVRRELARGARLRAALEQVSGRPNPVPLHVIGSEAHTAQRTAVVLERSRGKTAVRFEKPPRAADAVATLLSEPGDTMISSRTLRAEGLPRSPGGTLDFTSVAYSSEAHHELASSAELLIELESLLAEPTDAVAGSPHPWPRNTVGDPTCSIVACD